MSLRSDETKALRKGQKALARCRRDIGSAAFANEQANLKGASRNLRGLIGHLAAREELFETWLKQGQIQRLKRQ